MSSKISHEVRLQIISRKINTKLLEAEDFQDIKITYYGYVVKLHLHETKSPHAASLG